MDLQSLLGYSQNSPYSGNPFLDIHTPEGLIDMSSTPIDLMGIDNKGNKKKMKAGRKNPYKFEGDMVREIPLQQGGRTPIIVNNPNDPRLKAYSDSAVAYQKYGNIATDFIDGKYAKETDVNKLRAITKEGILNPLANNQTYYTNFTKDKKDNVIVPFFTKPVQPVVYQKPQKENKLVGTGKMPDGTTYEKYLSPQGGESYIYKKPQERKDYPLRGPLPKAQVRGTITPSIPEMMPQPEGDYIYGPANSVIGINTKNGFVPYTGENRIGAAGSQRGYVNQPDTNLMNNPEALKKYLLSKGIQNNPYQKGGFTKKDILNFLFEGDEKEDVPTAPTTHDVSPESQQEQQTDSPDQDYELALMIANEQAMGNPYEQSPTEGNPYSNDLSGYGENYKNIDSRVAMATEELLQKFPNLRLTSGRRSWGDKDAHPKGRAVDLSYDPQAYDYYKNTIVPKYGFNPALNPSHGTGPHIHLGYY